MDSGSKKPSERNRTIRLGAGQKKLLAAHLSKLPADHVLTAREMRDKIFAGEVPGCLKSFPERSVALLFLDPPYNLDKDYNGTRFRKKTDSVYRAWMESWFPQLLRLLRHDASIYFCADWRNSAAVFDLLSSCCRVRNRIVWRRDKGRGSARNWKNVCEDIWFATLGDQYTFHTDAVKVRKKVLAPYRENGAPKDWRETPEGKFRLTCPGNFWDDLTVPYWSMPENTSHPAQKPEKLLAKIILASSNPGDLVFDPFLGSGTSAVTAKKLGRHFCGMEREKEYCLLALERLRRAEKDPSVQGYSDGVFLDRNMPPPAIPFREK